ncbi:sigma 54-interacting transcriptional regulator [Enterococcus lemanii]|uniref:Sigma 54-interacting transcriptional regulator n=1 Tax=Enterococcus lemanii TaxID=1159752 RepID=A0ABV9MS75_9ENTE|nr:transcriptional regulator with AAA-type ATPase domain/transcriptional regulatory protein LevR [Enterococcus lemanii]
MRRLDKVYDKMKELSRAQVVLYGKEIQGVTALDISEALNLERANVSKDLNKLVSEGKAFKINTRPVLFFSTVVIEEKFGLELPTTSFESMVEFKLLFKGRKEVEEQAFRSLVGAAGSLKEAVKKAQAAILYPPNGLTTLITGETGVGKSLFAENMFQYAKKREIIQENAPFIIFNCADFADNQQLLLSHLFGYKKGAFTGADSDSRGLVDAAKEGFLFLDEVHRLSAKGQEMLFYLMDKGTYKRLGEVDQVEHANIHLIMATTEEPTNVMLNTFLRRIPVHIHLPSLYQKDWREKLEFIYSFIQEESQRIQKPIRVPQEVFVLLLNYHFAGNIGQMKSEIQYTCAHAFIDSLNGQKEEIVLKVNHLPLEIAQEISGLEEKRKEFYQLPESVRFESTATSRPAFINKQEEKIYEQMRSGLSLLGGSYSLASSKKWLRELLSEYMDKIVEKVTGQIYVEEEVVGEMQVPPAIYDMVQAVLAEYIEPAQRAFYTQMVAYHLTIVLKTHSFAENLKIEKEILMQHFLPVSSLITTITNELERNLQVSEKIHLSEFDRQVLEQILNYLLSEKIQPHVGILVVMHGESTASSIAKTVNDLLGITSVEAVNMHLDEKVKTVYLQTKAKVTELDEGLGVLILADMGSIKSFEQKLIEECSLKVRVMDMASTPLVLEAAKQSLNRQLSLDELVLSLSTTMARHWQRDQNQEEIGPPLRYFESLVMQQLKQILIFLDPNKIYPLFKNVLSKLENDLAIEVSDEFLLKFIFHNGCMLEKVLTEKGVPSQKSLSSAPKDLVYLKVQEVYQIVEEYFGISLPEEELNNIVDMLRYEYPYLWEEPTSYLTDTRE